jgi:hypothetical protein
MFGRMMGILFRSGTNQTGEEVTLDHWFCVSRAAALLEHATLNVLESKDVDSALHLADAWLTLSKLFAGEVEVAEYHPDVVEIDEDVETEMGFGFHEYNA